MVPVVQHQIPSPHPMQWSRRSQTPLNNRCFISFWICLKDFELPGICSIVHEATAENIKIGWFSLQSGTFWCNTLLVRAIWYQSFLVPSLFSTRSFSVLAEKDLVPKRTWYRKGPGTEKDRYQKEPITKKQCWYQTRNGTEWHWLWMSWTEK